MVSWYMILHKYYYYHCYYCQLQRLYRDRRYIGEFTPTDIRKFLHRGTPQNWYIDATTHRNKVKQQ